MNTRDLEYLIAVADELHFGRAAIRCNVSQSALSGQIGKLEDRLGVTIFERTKRHVQLTEIGRRLIARSKDVLTSVDALQRVAAAHTDPLAGHIVIGMPPTIGPYLTPLLLRVMKEYLPDLQLDLVEDFTDHLEDQLSDGSMDLAILATTPTRSNLSEIVLYKEPFWVAMPSGHPLTAEDSVDVEKIDASELLLLADGHCLRDQISEACKLGQNGKAGRRAARTQKTSLTTILSLVGSGYGVTLVPAMSLSEAWVTDAGIAIRREKSGKAGRTVRLTHRKGYPRMALVEKLADIVAGIVPDTVHAVRR
ncbi:MAG: LysR substrate-binding domain-containing protein [Alphaproteobacteria bacterium]